MKIETETLIIGAGPAGMAAAMELSKGKRDFVLVEKSDVVGGLSRTYTFDEGQGIVFHTDNGPHRFFSKNKYLYDFIDDILGDDWIVVNRQTRQYIDSKFYDYPINAFQALKNIGYFKAFRIIVDYLVAYLQYKVFRKRVTNFRDYVVANFGKTLGEFNMINYTEKIWGIDSRYIHIDWANQRIKGLNLFSVVKDIFVKLFGKSASSPKTLVDQFYYPKKGTGQIYETIEKKISLMGYKIFKSTYPVSIERNNGDFISKLIGKNGEEIEVRHRYLIESIPIVDFIKLVKLPKNEEVLDVLTKMKYRSQVYLFITLNIDKITNDQWIYFPSEDIPFGRISEMKNFSSYMSPKGKTSIFVEFFCNEEGHVWKMSPQELFEYSVPHFEKMGFFSRKDVRRYYRLSERMVYPVYDLQYKEKLSVLKKYLDNIENLFYIGRPGRFKYNNQDHSLEMGILAARSIIENRRYDIDKIGEENNYFEEGSVPKKN